MELPCGSGCVNQSTTLSWNKGSLTRSVSVGFIMDRVGRLLYHLRVQLITDEGYRAGIKLAEAELKIQQLEKTTAGEMKLKPMEQPE